MTSQSAAEETVRSTSTMTPALRLEQYGNRTGPGTAARTVFSDSAMFYAVIPTLTYVVMSEGGSKGVDDHDRVANLEQRQSTRFEGALGRLVDTVDLVAGLGFAEGEQLAQITEAMREIHRHVEGTLDDGRPYHAWNKDLWAWTWAGIIKPPLDAYEAFHGPVSAEFAADYYIGALQLGDLIGVRGLPETYPEFIDYWETVWMPQALGTGTARYILDLAEDLPRPAATPWLPKPMWSALTWPARNLMTSGAHLVMDPRTLDLLDARATRSQRLSVIAHKLAWRATPRLATRKLFATYIQLRLSHGNLSWHRHYSPAALADYHGQVQTARASGCPVPHRPSK